MVPQKIIFATWNLFRFAEKVIKGDAKNIIAN